VDNYGSNGAWLTDLKLNAILSKNLSQFATYKASVESIQDKINPNDLNELKKIGNRTKAIELVAKLVKDEKFQTAMDVAMSFSGEACELFEIFIQIFKKNQIGGIREIIILFIKARVMFNIVEEVCRLLSKSDKREILTKGRDKRLMMRGDYEEIMSSFPKGTPLRIIKESYDMAGWCQKFIPTIFIPIYEHHFKDSHGMLNFSRMMFLKHSNKRMEIPKAMVGQWMKHTDINHDEDYLQEVKDKFLRSGETTFVNHSNMCQGIPHYNSTVMALSCLSLRDALFTSCLKQMNMKKSIEWRTRAGSDDKGTIIGLDMSDSNSYYQYLLLGQCERAAERLHAMELSVKSASGSLMYELNSAFMANLETMSPTIKFSLASVDTIGTTSCTKFVNESYSRIRQLRENGATSLLCSYAHSRNSVHFYDIFATANGQENDLSKIFKTKLIDIPYDFGVYPQYDVDLQDVIGPEYYNYEILKRTGFTKQMVLLYTNVAPNVQVNEFTMFDEDTPLMKKDHFGIKQGLVRQLLKMRERVGAKSEQVAKYFEDNPFMMIRGPDTLDETLNLIYSKLFTQGAAESLRRTSSAIYIGRLSAFRTSRSWWAPSGKEEFNDLITGETSEHTIYSKSTYSEYLSSCVCEISEEVKLNLAKLMPVIFPQSRTFDVLSQFVRKFGPVMTSGKKFSQAVRSWTINNYNYEFSTSLRSILETSFKFSSESPVEDVEEFRRTIGFDLSSLESVIEQCKERGIRPLDMFYLMMKIHKGSRMTRVQTFAYGPSTNSVHLTALALKKYNHTPGQTMILDVGLSEDEPDAQSSLARKLDDVKLLHNLIVMRDNGKLTNLNDKDILALEGNLSLQQKCLTTIRSIKSISGYDLITQKTLKLVAFDLMGKHELKQKLSTWKTFNYTYLKKQKKTMMHNGIFQWSGDLHVLVSDNTECFIISEKQNNRYVTAKQVTNLPNFYLSLRDICKTLGFEFRTLFVNSQLQKGDIYLSDTTRNLHVCEAEGVIAPKLKLSLTSRFVYKRIQDLDDFKVIRDFNRKTGEIQIYLQDKLGRTSTICHSTGNFYPVTIPDDFRLANEKALFLGVRFNSLITNRNWFYDFRIPIMSRSETITFLKEDVDLTVLLDQDTIELNRIHQYMEAREEVSEEAFGITSVQVSTGQFTKAEANRLTEKSLFELFMDAMNATVLPESFSAPIGNWADYVEEHENEDLDELMGKLKDEEGINLVRAFGYKKPAAKRAMNTIHSLRQGSLLKSRVLNMFFKDGSIDSESNRQLPNMYLYLSDQILGKLTKTEVKLTEQLMELILERLTRATGSEPSRIRKALENKPLQHRIPVAVYHHYTTGNTGQQTDDLFEELLEMDEYDEYQSSNDGSTEL